MKKTPLAALSLPSRKASTYPWPLIYWPIEKEAVAKLKHLRSEFKKAFPEFSKLSKRNLERRGRQKGTSNLYPRLSLSIAMANQLTKARPSEILRALGKSTEPEDYHWLKLRLEHGKSLLRLLPREIVETFESMPKEAFLHCLPRISLKSTESK